MKLVAIAIVLTLLGGCTARESDDIVKLRLTQEFAKDERTFHECADWARESLGEDASGAEQMELTNSCLHMQTDLQDREADIKEKEEELESAKRELQEARRKIEDARRKREAERERELEETKRQLEEEKRKNEAAEREAARHDREWEILNDEVVALIGPDTPPFITDENKALSLAKKALRLAERRKGRDHPDTATSLHNLGLIVKYMNAFNPSRAEPYFRRALAIRESKLGKNHPDVAETLYQLASTKWFLGVGDPESAELLHLRALAIREAEFGESDLKVAESLRSLAFLYMKTPTKKAPDRWKGDQYSLALDYYRRVLPIYEAASGHAYRAGSVAENMASLYERQGDYSSAVSLYRRALNIYEMRFGKDSFVTRPLRYRLAWLYDKMGEANKAAAVRAGKMPPP